MQFITPTKDECDFLLIIFKTRKNKIMTTVQLIILILIALVIIKGYFGASLNLNEKKYLTGFIHVFVLTLMAGLCLLVAAIKTSEVNNLQKQLKDRCHQYEKVENVYKLKEVQNGH